MVAIKPLEAPHRLKSPRGGSSPAAGGLPSALDGPSNLVFRGCGDGVWSGRACGDEVANAPLPPFSPLDIAAHPNVGLDVLIAVSDAVTASQVARLMTSMPDVVVVGTAEDEYMIVDEALRLSPDVVVVDAEPPECNGLRVAARLARCGGPDVIVVSAVDIYAASAFDAAVLDYLLKPIRHDRLSRALDRARFRRVEREAHLATLRTRCAIPQDAAIHVPDRHGGRDVPVTDIVWIQADRDYALIHTVEKTHILRCTMARLASWLPPSLLRVHRSAFVATKHVRRWKDPIKGVHRLRLSNDVEVMVGPNYLSKVREILRSVAR